MDVSKIFEDDSLLVVNKPAGIVVNRADTTGKVETLQDWVDSNYKTLDSNQESEEFKSRSGIVHRLDKDTSGILVIAKSPDAFFKLKDQFKGREVVKKYLALVHGKVEPAEGSINSPIERSPFNRMHFGVFPGGREAQTDFKVQGQFDEYTLLELTPHTGRTHQIRVHLKYINHPIVSDPIYGGRKNVQADLKFCPRLFLHAEYLKIKHPVTGEVLEFRSELPPDLNGVLKLLK